MVTASSSSDSEPSSGGLRAVHAQRHAPEERRTRAVHLVLSLVQVVEQRLVPRQPRLRHQLHPRSVGGLVRGFRRSAPDGDSGVEPEAALAARSLQRHLYEHAVRHRQPKYVRVVLGSVAPVAFVVALVHLEDIAIGIDAARDVVADLERRVAVPGHVRAVHVPEAGHEPALVESPVALRNAATPHETGVFAEQLHDLVRRVPVRIEEDVGQPAAPQPVSDGRLGIDGVVVPRARRRIYPQRAQVAGVQDEVRRDPVQVVGELGPVRDS